MPERTQRILSELRDWCDEQRGRRSEVARAAGVERQAVYNWLAGFAEPTAEQILIVQDILERADRSREKQKGSGHPQS
jgi:transcriptional regulator with XRE-family HTH domain